MKMIVAGALAATVVVPSRAQGQSDRPQVDKARIQKMVALDWTMQGKITEHPDFDFEAFTQMPRVSQWANGYGIYLAGAEVDQYGRIVGAPLGFYQTSEGKKIPGRLIRKVPIEEFHVRAGDTVRTLRDTPLKSGKENLLTVKARTTFVAEEVRDKWVRVSVKGDDTATTGYLYIRHLTIPGIGFDEIIFDGSVKNVPLDGHWGRPMPRDLTNER